MRRIKETLDLNQKTKKSPDLHRDFFFAVADLSVFTDLGIINKINAKVKDLQQKLEFFSNSLGKFLSFQNWPIFHF
jgi:hypothetical protein